MGCFSQARKVFTHRRIFFQLRQCCQRSNTQAAFAIRRDSFEITNALQINEATGAHEVILHGS